METTATLLLNKVYVAKNVTYTVLERQRTPSTEGSRVMSKRSNEENEPVAPGRMTATAYLPQRTCKGGSFYPA